MEYLSTAQLAELHGVSTRRIYQIAKEDDPPPKAANGKIPAGEAGEWLRRQHSKKLGVQNSGEVLDLNAERARLAKEQADKAAMENARQRGELVPVSVVRKLLERILSVFKTHILAIPSKLAPLVLGLNTTAGARDAIAEHLHGALNELSRLNISELGAAGGDSGGKTTAKTNSKRVGRRAPKTKPGGKRRTRAVAN